MLETLANRSLIRERDPNRQEFLPTLLSFEFSSNKDHLALAKQSVATVLYALTALFLKHDDDQMHTVDQIEAQAKELGRAVGPDTVWLGLYFAEEFGVLGGWASADNPAIKSSVRVSEWILREKDLDNAWENLVKTRTRWQLQRESYIPVNLVTGRPEIEEIPSDATPSELHMKQADLQVFISHSSRDHDIALSLIELLQAALGLKVQEIRCTSIDGYRLEPGAQTDHVLKEEVLQAKTFIGLITPNSLVSAYVLFELGARWGGQKKTVPLLAGLGPEALQGPLKNINAVSANEVGSLLSVIESLAKNLGRTAQPAHAYYSYADKLVQQTRKLQNVKAMATAGVERIAYHFRAKQAVHIYGLYNKEPKIEERGEAKLNPEQEARASALRVQWREEERSGEKQRNDPHGLLVGEPLWSEQELTFQVEGLDYAAVLACTRNSSGPDNKLQLISSNAVIVCPESKELILHYRAAGVRTFPDCLHTVGGGYMPSGFQHRHDRCSLKRNVIREMEEETSVNVGFDETPPLIITEELETGWIQVAFLGVAISAAQAANVHKDANTYEGIPQKVRFDDLESRMRDRWVPTGKAAVLAWLSLGAPGAGPDPRFGKFTPAELFETIIQAPNTNWAEAFPSIKREH